MKYLLDTHVFLWWIGDSQKLSQKVVDIIGDGANQLFFSAVSAWEMAIKINIGKLSLPKPADEFIVEKIKENRFSVLPISLLHSLKQLGLKNNHRDPFDRMLVSQSLSENLPILSRDQQIKKYGAKIIW